MTNFSDAKIKLSLSDTGDLVAPSLIDEHCFDELKSPFLLSLPHSGRDYPKDFVEQSPLNITKLRSSEDLLVDLLFENHKPDAFNRITANFPRAYVDVNRYLDELDPELIEGLETTHKTDLTRAGYGVIARKVARQKNIYAGKISLIEAERRLKKHYKPYHLLLKNFADKSRQKYDFSFILDAHSMPSYISKYQAAPDFIIGDLKGKSADPRISHIIYHHLKEMGFNVVLNQFYSGGAITKIHHDLDLNSHVVQLEINRGLYVNEETYEQKAYFKKLKLILLSMLEKIAELDLDQLQTKHQIQSA